MTSKKEIAVYTAIFGDYDQLKEPKYPAELSKEADFFCFTNNRNIVSDFYLVVYVDLFFKRQVLNARLFKTMSHRLFPHYKHTVWHDGAFQIVTRSIHELIETHMTNGYYLATFKHPDRNDLYDEAAECVQRRKEQPSRLLRQVFKYCRAGMPADFGLIESSILLRKGNGSAEVIKLNEAWWQEIRKHTSRDQVSFSYVWWKTKAQVNFIAGHNKANEYFLRSPHRPRKDRRRLAERIITNRYFSPIVITRYLSVRLILFLKETLHPKTWKQALLSR